MTTAEIEVTFAPNADHHIVRRLVEQHAKALAAGIKAKKARGRPGSTILTTDGYVLVCFDQQWAQSQGIPLAGSYGIFGMPQSRKLCRSFEVRAQ
jgi:hypothetical protein